MDLGGRIKVVRKEVGLSQEALARRADVSMNLIGRIETGGITDPHYSTLTRIAAALHTSVAELIGETAPKALART